MAVMSIFTRTAGARNERRGAEASAPPLYMPHMQGARAPPKRLKLPVLDVMDSTYDDENSPCHDAPVARSSRSMDSDGSALPSPSCTGRGCEGGATGALVPSQGEGRQAERRWADLREDCEVEGRAVKDDVHRVLVAADGGTAPLRRHCGACEDLNRVPHSATAERWLFS